MTVMIFFCHMSDFLWHGIVVETYKNSRFLKNIFNIHRFLPQKILIKREKIEMKLTVQESLPGFAPAQIFPPKILPLYLNSIPSFQFSNNCWQWLSESIGTPTSSNKLG